MTTPTSYNDVIISLSLVPVSVSEDEEIQEVLARCDLAHLI